MAQALASGFVQSGQVDAASVSFYDPAEASICLLYRSQAARPPHRQQTS